MREFFDTFFNGKAFEQSRYLLWLGCLGTLRFVGAAFVSGVVVGVALNAVRASRLPILRWVAQTLVDLVRAVPPLVSLVAVFFLVPSIGGLTLDTFWAMVVTFSLVEGAYISEILRGGRRAVDIGQTDAAAALGMTVYKSARHVVAPQMSRVILPPMTSQFTQLVRDSSLGFFIGYQDLVTRAREGVRLTSNPTPYMAAVIVYAVVLSVLQVTSSWLERREYSAR